MQIQDFSFGSIHIDGTTHDDDVVIEGGEIRKRKKKPSRKFRDDFGHTPLVVRLPEGTVRRRTAKRRVRSVA